MAIQTEFQAFSEKETDYQRKRASHWQKLSRASPLNVLNAGQNHNHMEGKKQSKKTTPSQDGQRIANAALFMPITFDHSQHLPRKRSLQQWSTAAATVAVRYSKRELFFLFFKYLSK